MALRRLGVYGENLPTKKERSVVPADFTIAGLVGSFNRKYNKLYRFRNTQEAIEVLGGQDNPNYYGWDCLNGFFANLQGQPGSIIVLSLAGIGATAAEATIQTILGVKSAYQGEPSLGAVGNRVGITIEKGSVFTTAIAEAAAAVSTIKVDSIIGFRVGDVISLNSAHYIIQSISESDGTITVSNPVTAAVGDEIVTDAYRVHTWLKDSKGVVTEVGKELSKTWVTLNETDTDRYIVSVFSNSSYLTFEKLASFPEAGLTAFDVIEYLTGGTDGTMPSTAAQYEAVFPLLDGAPFRMISLCETANQNIQRALEDYCRNREDNPLVFIVPQMGIATKQAALSAGQSFQRSNEVDAIQVLNWLQVPDPFASSPTAPKRQIPAVGHLMGQWIQSIGANGVHSSQARKDIPILGAADVVGYIAFNDYDRTDLAEAGINVIQNMTGRGLVLRNSFTPSTSPEFRYANAVIQRNYIKISVVDSLQESENAPNTIGRVREDRMAALQFMNKLWMQGSNGNVPEGETFGQYEREDGSTSTKAEAFEVIADVTNNSVASLQAGERNIDIWFMFAAPAGSIRVGVGIIYRVS